MIQQQIISLSIEGYGLKKIVKINYKRKLNGLIIYSPETPNSLLISIIVNINEVVSDYLIPKHTNEIYNLPVKVSEQVKLLTIIVKTNDFVETSQKIFVIPLYE